MNALVRTSIFTLALIFSFILFIFILIGLYSEAYSVYVAIALTIAVNFSLWAIGPTISDFLYKHLYKAKLYTKEEFFVQNQELASFIDSVCISHNFSFPKIGIIDDKNPTAFTYGSTRNNARIIFTTGLLHYLNPKEQEIVIAHELGHIYHYDFVIMTIATTLVQILYEIYYVLSKSRSRSSGKKGSPLASIGFVAYIFYLVSSYLLLFLSRVREYYADQFAASITKNPHALTQALVKIAYGIVQAEDSPKAKRLLGATRNLGLIDTINAGFIGSIAYVSTDPQMVGEVMAFDIVSPWAKVLELSSTHPLTGKRIHKLETLAEQMGQQRLIDFNSVLQRLNINRNRLNNGFLLQVFIYFLPLILPLPGFFIFGIGGALIAFALGAIIKLNYRMRESATTSTTVFNQMRNPYASPMRGENIRLEGEIVGRGVPGFVFSEDAMFQDRTGILYLDYNSSLGFIGNILFAIKKIKTLIGQPVTAEGWFFRGLTQKIALRKITHHRETISSHPKLWGMIVNIFILIVGIFLLPLNY